MKTLSRRVIIILAVAHPDSGGMDASECDGVSPVSGEEQLLS